MHGAGHGATSELLQRGFFRAIADDHAGTALEPLLLTSLLEAADRVDSTTGLQMAYLSVSDDEVRQAMRAVEH